jgi:hypothetical protein
LESTGEAGQLYDLALFRRSSQRRRKRPAFAGLFYFTPVTATFICAPQFAQRPQFVALDRVNRMKTAFEAPDVQMTLGKVDLISAQIDSFGDAQAVAGDEKH